VRLVKAGRLEVDIAEKAAKLTEAMRRMGCSLNNACMQHSLLALVAIPELRISDTGIIDVTKCERVELFV
jgi:adenine deaminase